jgi:hypothetical protein
MLYRFATRSSASAWRDISWRARSIRPQTSWPHTLVTEGLFFLGSRQGAVRALGVLLPGLLYCRRRRCAPAATSIYLLYWYKNTNNDAAVGALPLPALHYLILLSQTKLKPVIELPKPPPAGARHSTTVALHKPHLQRRFRPKPHL